MNYNPYVAPQAGPPPGAQMAGPPGMPGSPQVGAPQPWEIGEVISAAWNAFKPNWAIVLFAPIVGGLVAELPALIFGFVAGMLQAMGARGDNSALQIVGSVVQLVGMLGTYILMGAIYTGIFRITVGVARNQPVSFGMVFSGFGRMFPMFFTFFLMVLAIGIGYVFLIVPGVILALGLGFAPYFIADQANMGPIDALKASWQATNGQKGKLFVFGLACAGIMLAGYIACGVGILVAMPVVLLSQAFVYTRVSGTAVNAPAQGPMGMAPAMAMGPAPAGFGAPPAGGFGGGYGPPGGGMPPQGGGYGGPPGGGMPPQGGGGYGGPPQGGGGYGGPQGGGGYGGPQGGGGMPPGGGYGPPGGGMPPQGGGGYGPPGGGGYGPPGGGGGYGR